MTQQDYEQKKCECWEEFKREVQCLPVSRHDVFCAAFDRAYALGKETETITQEEIEKAAEEYVLTRQQARHNAKREEDATLRDFDKTIKAWDAFDMEQAYEDGANFALGKQEKDAEGEEMLTAMKWKVQEQYANYNKELKHDGLRHIEYEKAKEVVKVLYYLFGSKCLPDDGDNLSPETKPAEPKFKVGDKVRIKGCGYEPNLHKGDIGEILDTNDKEQCFVLFKKSQAWIYIDCLEPYTEPTANYMQVDYHGADTAASTIADSCQSQPVTDYFNRILKDGFREHNRLHIAAQIVAAIYANYQAAKGFKSIEEIVRKSLDIADTLIKESEKEGSK